MLLLINGRYPVLGTVLGVLVSVASTAYGVATAHSVMILAGAFGLALSAARIAKQVRQHASQARS
jgi:hypothetical protein